MSLRSAYERRFRRRDDSGKEPLSNSAGNPTYVVDKGALIGLRATDGSVIPVGARRVEDVPDTDWVWVGGEWRERWR